MSELRQDVVTGRWVIVAADRRRRPSDYRPEKAQARGRDECPFCGGREHLTPPEVLAVRPGGGTADGPGWELRVVPNKFPALDAGGDLEPEAHGLFARMNGVGVHEVVIETPDHGQTLATLGVEAIERLLCAFRDRVLALQRDPRFQYVVLFKNHGSAAGATLEHPHAQLIALPIVPGFVREELDGARQHYATRGRCVFCETVDHESAGERVVSEDRDMLALAPYASRFPFEVWVVPKVHGARFEGASPGAYRCLAAMLKGVLTRIDRALDRPDYNLIVHTSPVSEASDAYYHWHVEIIPKLTPAAGFEWGTGFYINHTTPEEAAEALRAVRV